MSNEELIEETRKFLFTDSKLGFEDTLEGDLIYRLVEALVFSQDVREHLHAKCDCAPDLGPAHCHLCSKDTPVTWEDCEAVTKHD